MTSTDVARIIDFPEWWSSRSWNVGPGLHGSTTVTVQHEGVHVPVLQLGMSHSHRISGYRLVDPCESPYQCVLPQEIDVCAGERYQHNVMYVETDSTYETWLRLATPVNVAEAVAEAVEFGARQVIALMTESVNCDAVLVEKADELAEKLGTPLRWTFSPNLLTDYRDASSLIEAAMRSLL
jgi:hypothetical protein